MTVLERVLRGGNMQRLLMILSVAATALLAGDEKPNALAQFSGALERLAATVAPAVVQVQVSGWCGSDSGSREDGITLRSCRVVGSGVIVDPSGYIITNEHVVRNARSIRVKLTPKSDEADGTTLPRKSPVLDAVIQDANRDPVGKRRVLDATVAGASRDTDLALLKIEASGLPAISIEKTARNARQGEVVLAVGSPDGLDNTMTVGIVSAVGRQPHPDYPMVYIQTDAAINPGNSGGPLLDVEGQLIGINTFILSESGRNQGLGFAVPAAVVRYVYGQLRANGKVRQSLFGVRVQTVTPGLAQGLGLSRGYGVMISDVLSGSPAEEAGLRRRDIITAIDGAAISALPYYTALMYLHDPAMPVAVTVLRGTETLQFLAPAVAVDDQVYTDASIDPHKSVIPELGVFGRTLTPALARKYGFRSTNGIYVVAITAAADDSGTGLVPGDAVSSLNGVPIYSVQDLREAIHELPDGKPAVFEIERSGQFLYVERELDAWPQDTRSDGSGTAEYKARPDGGKR
jgi:serine protease Do